MGSEDYRWEIIQNHIPVWAFKILNVTFISFQQSVILYALAVPAYPILLSTQFRPEVNASDLAFTAFELGLVVTEYIADQQQWGEFVFSRMNLELERTWPHDADPRADFQNAKHEYQKTAKLPQAFHADDLNRGFITSGLWAYSRHPNFAIEQTIWMSLYAWSAYSTQSPFFWAATGAVSLLSIFFASTILTEWITAGKYPEYAEYQKQVGKFMPLSFRGYQPPATPAKKIANGDKAKQK